MLGTYLAMTWFMIQPLGIDQWANSAISEVRAEILLCHRAGGLSSVYPTFMICDKDIHIIPGAF